MAYSLDDLAAIKQAIGTGELHIEKDGVRVTYRSIAELKLARREIEADLQRSGQLPGAAPRTSYAQFERD